MTTTVSYKGSTIATVDNNTKTLTTQGKYLEADVVLTDVSSGTPTLQTKSVSITPSTSAQSQTVTPDVGYDGLDEVDVNVSAMPSGSIGNPSVARSKDSSSYMATVTYPNFSAGYIGSVSAVGVPFNIQTETVTPSTATQTIAPTNDMYYLDEVTVNPIPSEYIIPSGTYTVSGSGTSDITDYATLSVPSGTAGTPTATKGTVTNHSVTVTPSVTNVTGYITGSTKTGTPVTVTADELISFSTIRTGSSAPSDSLGTDGDIYLQTS